MPFLVCYLEYWHTILSVGRLVISMVDFVLLTIGLGLEIAGALILAINFLKIINTFNRLNEIVKTGAFVSEISKTSSSNESRTLDEKRIIDIEMKLEKIANEVDSIKKSNSKQSIKISLGIGFLIMGFVLQTVAMI